MMYQQQQLLKLSQVLSKETSLYLVSLTTIQQPRLHYNKHGDMILVWHLATKFNWVFVTYSSIHFEYQKTLTIWWGFFIVVN